MPAPGLATLKLSVFLEDCVASVYQKFHKDVAILNVIFHNGLKMKILNKYHNHLETFSVELHLF